MSVKYPANGIIINVASTGSPTNVLGGLKEIAFLGGEREMIDVTNHGSSGTKEMIPHPLRNLRSMEVTIFYDPADTQHERMRAAHAAATLEYQTVVLTDAGDAQYAMSGYITDWSIPTLGQDGALEVTYTFQATSAETFTA